MTHPTDLARRCLLGLLESDRAFGLDEIAGPIGTRAATRAAAGPAAPAALPPAPAPAAAAPAAMPRAPAPAAAARGRPARATLVPPLRELLGCEEKRRRMQELEEEIAGCTRCRLHQQRTTTVPGEGSVDADLMFVGEGPGADEDASGRPFVGKAGELLTRIIEAMGFTRESVYIANVVKCRPPGNRTPEADEAAACMPFLRRQIELIGPRVICALGNPASRALLGTTRGVSALRGTVQHFGGIPVMPTFHPAYLLRTPQDKPKVWQDMQAAARLVEERGGAIPKRDVFERNARGAAAGGR